MQLLRQKLQQESLYKRELSKMKGKKEVLFGKSKERQGELTELRLLFSRSKVLRIE